MKANTIDNKYLSSFYSEKYIFEVKTTRDIIVWLYRPYIKLSGIAMIQITKNYKINSKYKKQNKNIKYITLNTKIKNNQQITNNQK